MSIRVPPKRIRERFQIIYELEGCQRAVNFLTEYYGVRRMKIILDGRKVGKRYIAYYFENKAYFKKRGLKKRTVLHELYHHLVRKKGVECDSNEEKQAVRYASEFLHPKGVSPNRDLDEVSAFQGHHTHHNPTSRLKGNSRVCGDQCIPVRHLTVSLTLHLLRRVISSSCCFPTVVCYFPMGLYSFSFLLA